MIQRYPSFRKMSSTARTPLPFVARAHLTSGSRCGLLFALCLAVAAPSFASEPSTGHLASAEQSPGASDHDAHSVESHGVDSHGADSHVADHHGHAAPTLEDINWVEGLFGGRSESTPVPFLAMLVNTALLLFLLIKVGGPGIRQGLVSRRNRLAADIDAAAAMQKEAEEQLRHYQEKLAHMEAEAEDLEKSMRDNAAREREKVLEEAKIQRDNLMKEAEDRVSRELLARKEALVRRLVADSVRAAEQAISSDIRAQDQAWFGQRMLEQAGTTRGANS